MDEGNIPVLELEDGSTDWKDSELSDMLIEDELLFEDDDELSSAIYDVSKSKNHLKVHPP